MPSATTVSFLGEVDAERFLTAIEHSMLTGGYVDPRSGRIPFKAYAESWRKRQIHGSGTETSVEQHFRLRVYPKIGGRPIGAIRASEIQSLVQHLAQKLAPSNIEVVDGRVVSVFKDAVKDRVIPASPCVVVQLPMKKPATTLEVLTTDNVMVPAGAIAPRYRGLIIATAGTGLRTGEIFGLCVDRVDFLRKTLRVDQQLVRVPGQGVALAGHLKTKTSYRWVPLADPVVQAIAAHLAQWPAHPELGLVFTNTRGGPIQESPFASTWRTGRTKARLPP